jgi:hypothetical protein
MLILVHYILNNLRFLSTNIFLQVFADHCLKMVFGITKNLTIHPQTHAKSWRWSICDHQSSTQTLVMEVETSGLHGDDEWWWCCGAGVWSSDLGGIRVLGLVGVKFVACCRSACVLHGQWVPADVVQQVVPSNSGHSGQNLCSIVFHVIQNRNSVIYCIVGAPKYRILPGL